jgi:serine/threonine-protein kinase
MIGETIDGRYRVLRVLGQGGMGAVYEAEHTGTRRRVAIKVIINAELAKHESIVQRFQREAKAAGSIETEHIVQVLDTGMDTKLGMPYMVMEFLRGEDLGDLVKRCTCLHPELALRLVGQSCLGLQKAHEGGVVHRDIKPANLFLSRREDGNVIVKIVDFGIAKIKADIAGPEDTGLTRTGNLLGSPRYMSPEQAMGSKNIDHRTDIWSMGVVLYEALTGRVPHAQCDSLGAMILAICSQEAPNIQDLAPWVPPEVASLVHAALVIDVNRRFQSVGAMLAAIRSQVQSFNVSSDMLVPITAETKAYKAPRTFSGNTRLPLAVSTGTDPGTGAGTGASTGPGTALGGGPITGAAAQSLAGVQTVQPHRPSRMPAITVGVLVVAGAVGAFGYKLSMKGRAESTQPDHATTAPVEPPPPQPTASASTEPVLSPGERTAKLTIVAPPAAIVEVDDQVVQVQDGTVDVHGALGSTHRVRIKMGKTETVGEVVVADSGAVPNKVQLGVAIQKPSKPSAEPGAKPTKPAEPGVARQFD